MNFKLSSRRFILGLTLVAISGFLTSGCSTPPVADETQQEAYDNALSSYDNCNAVRRPVGLTSYCSNVGGSGGARSYADYIYGQGSGARSESDSAGQSAGPHAEQDAKVLRAAYASYLATLSKEQLVELAAKWQN